MLKCDILTRILRSYGPRFVADFEEIADPEEREIRERDAYERVRYVLQKLGLQ